MGIMAQTKAERKRAIEGKKKNNSIHIEFTMPDYLVPKGEKPQTRVAGLSFKSRKEYDDYRKLVEKNNNGKFFQNVVEVENPYNFNPNRRSTLWTSSNKYPWASKKPCEWCNGSGQIFRNRSEMESGEGVKCKKCRGNGY